MNDKLKREYKRLKISNKEICVKVVVSDYDDENILLDSVAALLEKDVQFLQLTQGDCSDKLFLDLSKKVMQLSAMYNATVVLSGSLVVSHFVNPDGIILTEDDLEPSLVKELYDENIIFGYCCDSLESANFAIKRGAEYLTITTPPVFTNNVVTEYAKWVYENINIPIFLEVDLYEKLATLKAASINKFILSVNLFNSIYTHLDK